MISNGRRIDQRTTMNQGGGVDWFFDHLRLNSFEPLVFDGRDPAAFVWAIIEQEERLKAAGELARAGQIPYPVRLPYGVAVAPKGFGFYGAGTNLAHNLPRRQPGATRGPQASTFGPPWVPARAEGNRPAASRAAAVGRRSAIIPGAATSGSSTAHHRHWAPGSDFSRGRGLADDAIDETFLATSRQPPPRVGSG
jgi:hypothetical protein